MLRKIYTESTLQRAEDWLCYWMHVYVCERACQLESRIMTLFVCVWGGGGQLPLAGRFGAAPVVCVCVYGAHGSCAREWRQQPSLSLSLSFSSSLPLVPHSPLWQHPGTQTSPPFFSHLQLFHSVRPSVPLEPSPCVWEFRASLRISSAPPATSASAGRRER